MKVRKLKRKIKLKSKIFNFFWNNDIPLKNIDFAKKLEKLRKKCYYFEKNSTLEIDFFIRYNNQVTAVEVKSADNTKSKSLKSVMENYGVKSGLKLSSKNLDSNNENVTGLPIYMSIFL